MLKKLKQAEFMYKTIYGINLKQVSELLELDYKNVLDYFNENNIKIEKRGNNPKLPLYLKGLEMYKSGKSINQISIELGICRNRLSLYIRKNGVETRKLPNKKNFDNKVFDIIDTEEKAYWLGFLYADGCVSDSRNSVELALKSSDIKHIEKFKDFLKSEHKISYKTSKLGDAYRISIRDEYFKNSLIKSGCVPKKSLILRFPNKDIIPIEMNRHFIRGYFDGDGCIYTDKKGKVTISMLGTREFLKGCSDVCLVLKNKNTYIVNNKEENVNNYKFSFQAKKDVYGFLEYLYKDSNVYLDRKYFLYENYLKCLPS